MSENFFNRSRDANKGNQSQRLNSLGRQRNVRSANVVKPFGPYRIKNVCHYINRMGIDPVAPQHFEGMWFIGELPGNKVFWVKVDCENFLENQRDAIGILEENYIGKLFKVEARSGSTHDLMFGKAYLMDDEGSGTIKGYPQGEPSSKFPSTVATSVASLCGPFTFTFPDLGKVLEKINKG